MDGNKNVPHCYIPRKTPWRASFASISIEFGAKMPEINRTFPSIERSRKRNIISSKVLAIVLDTKRLFSSSCIKKFYPMITAFSAEIKNSVINKDTRAKPAYLVNLFKNSSFTSLFHNLKTKGALEIHIDWKEAIPVLWWLKNRNLDAIVSREPKTS